ncbi:MAG: DedA family protein [Candidatus Asgardarchaeia archaeon]
MIEELIFMIVGWIRTVRGWGVFLGVIIESLIPPIPSPLVPMAAAFALIPSESSFMGALLVSLEEIVFYGAIAATVGSLVGYGIGLYGGYPIVKKYGFYLGVSEEDLRRFERRLNSGHKGEAIIFLSRTVPIVPLSLVSIGAGIVNLGLTKFLIWTFLGSVPRYLFLSLLGWAVGIAYENVAHYIDQLENLFYIAIIVIILIFVYKGMKKKDKGEDRSSIK